MPDAATILRIYAKATAACTAAPGRTGHLVRLENADEVLIAGDLHGHVDHFRAVFQKSDLASRPRRHLVLQEVIHGPFQYPDQSDKSHQLLDLVAATLAQFPGRVHFLPGNHEFAQFANRPVARSSGELNSLYRAGVTMAYGPRAEEVYTAMMELIAAAPLAVRTSNRVFMSHSLPPGDAAWDPSCLTAEPLPADTYQPGGGIYQLVWGRDVSETAARAFLDRVDADLLITGHIPCENGWFAPNDRQLILDAQQSPGGYCLFPADRPLTHSELLACVATL